MSMYSCYPRTNGTSSINNSGSDINKGMHTAAEIMCYTVVITRMASSKVAAKVKKRNNL